MAFAFIVLALIIVFIVFIKPRIDTINANKLKKENQELIRKWKYMNKSQYELELLRKANLGRIDAQSSLAGWYCNGHSVDDSDDYIMPNLEEANYWTKRIGANAKRGNWLAMAHVAQQGMQERHEKSDRDVLLYDMDLAAKYVEKIKKAANANDSGAMLAMHQLECDNKKSFAWLLKASQHENEDSFFFLSKIYGFIHFFPDVYKPEMYGIEENVNIEASYLMCLEKVANSASIYADECMYEFAAFEESHFYPSEIYLKYMRKSANAGNLKAIQIMKEL
ncbi:MAG: hypothetical protein FWC16_08415 [Defluviitaleaceae bacterium]|nr:hypothetical protein [Defluviitaleaceae bacterium]MCL2274933.1 hypothetical protein [Defluviitaleaceae bacterium]